MKKCRKCHTSDYPDTATTCTNCGHSPLTPYRKRNLDLRHSDFVSLGAYVPEVKSTTTTPAMIIPLLGALLLLGFIILPLFFTPVPSSSAFSKPTATLRPTVLPTATPMPTVPPTATPMPTVPPTATPMPTVLPTATPMPTVLPTATPMPTVPPTATPMPTVPPTATPTPVIHTLTSQVQTQSQTVNATGQGTTPGTQATGTLRFTCPYISCQTTTYSADTVFNGDGDPGSSVQMMIDAPVTVPGWSGHNVYVSAPAHVVKPGTIGNISSTSTTAGWPGWTHYGDDNNNPPQRQLDIDNSTPFTGGTDSQPYIFVQQSDIDTAAHSLEPSTRQSAITDIESQLQPNEHLNAPQCHNTVTSDHLVGDQATIVKVTVETTCTARAST